jgi:Arc/MetJ family transcription regulator
MAVLSYHRGMAKRKTTLYIDDDVMTATKATAMAMHSTDSAFVEDALRAYLKTSRAEAARGDLRAVLDRLAAQNPDDLSDEEAMELAVEEVRAVRAERRSRK